MATKWETKEPLKVLKYYSLEKAVEVRESQVMVETGSFNGQIPAISPCIVAKPLDGWQLGLEEISEMYSQHPSSSSHSHFVSPPPLPLLSPASHSPYSLPPPPCGMTRFLSEVIGDNPSPGHDETSEPHSTADHLADYTINVAMNWWNTSTHSCACFPLNYTHNSCDCTVLEDLLHSDEHAEHEHHAQLVILFPFVVLLIGAAAETMVHKSPIPYTSFLLIIGGLLGYFMKVRSRLFQYFVILLCLYGILISFSLLRCLTSRNSRFYVSALPFAGR
jgi:hypothetical protein